MIAYAAFILTTVIAYTGLPFIHGVSSYFSSVQVTSGSKFFAVNYSELCLLQKHCRRWRRLDSPLVNIVQILQHHLYLPNCLYSVIIVKIDTMFMRNAG